MALNRKVIAEIAVVAIVLLVGAFYIYKKHSAPAANTSQDANLVSDITPAQQSKPQNNILREPEVLVEGLTVPWDFAFLTGDQGILITERPGNLVLFKVDGTKTNITIPRAKPRGEGGLLGLKLHPNFAQNHFLYLYMSTSAGLTGTKNAVFRYTFENNELKNEKLIIGDIPGALYHDGGRLEFGPDGYLYITTGDAQNENIAQDKNSLGGKILRLYDDGRIPTDNPFGSAVWSLGHRNPQGLAWDSAGRLWETEHGRSGITSGLDEINLIEKGGNYGWPTIEGDEEKAGMQNPVQHSGPDTTWAPASALFYDGSIFFGGLRGETLYEAVLDGTQVARIETHFKNRFGRIRTVRLGPDGLLYFTTSNRDGRGSPQAGDDKIVRVDPRAL